MRCPNCGLETENEICEYCNTRIISQRERNNPKNIFFKKVFPFPAKIVFILWFLDSLCMLFSGESEISFLQWIGIFLFGSVFFVGITDLIYYNRKKGNVRSSRQRVQQSIAANQVSDPIRIDQLVFSESYDSMEGHQFEYFCGELLKKNGYSDVEVTRGSGDQGIDILAVKDGIKYGIQCKCYSSNIGNKAVQEAFAGKTFYGCHVAAVLTNRHFTRSAKELAESNGVLLWDQDKLKELVANAENN